MENFIVNKVKKYILPYSVGIALPLVVGAISAFLTIESMDIYSIIKTPPLSPPPFIFPIIWTVLFILMGISSTTVFLNRERNSEAARQGLCAYFTSLVLNFGWSLIFFNVGAFLFAFFWLLMLLYFVIRTVIFYFKVDLFSAVLQIPYVLWIIFAGYLNIMIYILN